MTGNKSSYDVRMVLLEKKRTSSSTESTAHTKRSNLPFYIVLREEICCSILCSFGLSIFVLFPLPDSFVVVEYLAFARSRFFAVPNNACLSCTFDCFLSVAAAQEDIEGYVLRPPRKKRYKPITPCPFLSCQFFRSYARTWTKCCCCCWELNL